MGKVKIGDFLYRIRRPIILNTNDDYNLVTIKMKHKGVTLRGSKKGFEIKSKMYQVKEGDFILSGIDARNGAFGIIPKELDGAIVTNDFWYFSLDKTIIDKYFFLELTSTSWFDEICRLGSDGTTQRIRLQKNKFFNQEINLPILSEQQEFISQFIKSKNINTNIDIEITYQKILLKKLRQAILQEAIEGKLTTSWREQNRDIESASILLEKIKVEKEQLIKEKKIKKQKPLSPINKYEIPFNLPDSWKWCRLGDITQVRGGKRVTNGYKLLKIATPYVYLRVSDMKNLTINESDLHYLDESMRDKIKQYIITNDDLYMVIVGGTIGKCGIVPIKFSGMNLTENAVRITPFQVEKLYLLSCFIGDYCQKQFIDKTKSVGVQKMAINRFNNTLLPLPPLKEQKQIVQKIQTLFKICDNLETQINNSKTNSQTLMKAVLKEAFEMENKNV